MGTRHGGGGTRVDVARLLAAHFFSSRQIFQAAMGSAEDASLLDIGIEYKAMGVPQGLIGKFLPDTSLTVRELIDFPLHDLCATSSKQECATVVWSPAKAIYPIDADFLTAFRLPPIAILKSFWNTVSAPAPTISVNKITFPRAIALVWRVWSLIHTARLRWRDSLAWLEDARVREPAHSSLFSECIDSLSTLRWAGGIQGFSSSGGATGVASLTRFLSNEWLAGDDLSHLCDILRDQITDAGHRVRLVSTTWYPLVVSAKQQTSSSNSSKTPLHFRHFSRDGAQLASGSLTSIAGILNLGECHWVAFAIDFKARAIMIGDSLILGGIDALTRTATHSRVLRDLQWWIATFVPGEGDSGALPFRHALLPISTQSDSISCGMFAFNCLQRFVLGEAHPRYPAGASMRYPRASFFLDVVKRHMASASVSPPPLLSKQSFTNHCGYSYHLRQLNHQLLVLR